MSQGARFNYVCDLSSVEKELLAKTRYNQLRLKQLTIPTSAISKDYAGWLHAVEASKDKDHIIIRVISNQNRGVNIHVPLTSDVDARYAKYRDLRYQIRNTEKVLITFPELTIFSTRQGELFLMADDFKIFDFLQMENEWNGGI